MHRCIVPAVILLDWLYWTALFKLLNRWHVFPFYKWETSILGHERKCTFIYSLMNVYKPTSMSFFVFRSWLLKLSLLMYSRSYSDFSLRSIMSGRLSRLWSDGWKLFSSLNGASWNCCSKVKTASEWRRKPHTFVYDGTWGRRISQIPGLRGASEPRFSWCSETDERKAQVRVMSFIYLFSPSY